MGLPKSFINGAPRAGLRRAGCNACYIGETSRYLSVRVREHLKRDRTSHVCQYLTQSEQCRRHYSETCCSVLDTAPNRYQLSLKEAAHMPGEILADTNVFDFDFDLISFCIFVP